MGNDLVREQLSITIEKLKLSSDKLRHYLNDTTLYELMKDGKNNAESEYEDILDQFRRILVYFDEGQEAGNLLLRSETFRKGAAEKTLYWIFHQCIEEFFQPRLDVWYEDSRAAYTGKNAIRFRAPVPAQLRQLVSELEGPIQEIREELEYYETDYRTKVQQRDGN